MDAMSLDRFDAAMLASLLAEQRAYGVEDALDEDAPDRFAALPTPAPVAPAAPGVPRPVPAAPPVRTTAEGDAMEARRLASSATSLGELLALLNQFEGCGLKATANRTVFADGVPGSDLMLVGEAPGRDEDMAGVPFVGRSGQLLDRMLAAIGRDRTNVYIANVIPWRPPGNRTPTPQEVAVCKPFVERQIQLADPKLIVFLGGAAASALTGSADGVKRLRGRVIDVDIAGMPFKAVATLHPAYLLRQPVEKRLAWRDLLLVARLLGEGTRAAT